MHSFLENTVMAIKEAGRREGRATPRNTARDKEIVRLRDEKGLSFGQIGRELVKINSEWVDDDGDPMSDDIVFGHIQLS